MHNFHVHNKTTTGDLIFTSILHHDSERAILCAGKALVLHKSEKYANSNHCTDTIIEKSFYPAAFSKQNTGVPWGCSYLHTTKSLNVTFQLGLTLPSNSTITLRNLHFFKFSWLRYLAFQCWRQGRKLFPKTTTNSYSTSRVFLSTRWSKLLTHSAKDFTQVCCPTNCSLGICVLQKKPLITALYEGQQMEQFICRHFWNRI